jgi:hypothetical protein
VTEVLDPLLELDGIPRALLKAAAAFGTHVHMACDLFDRGVLDEPALDPHLSPYLAAWKLFLRDVGAEVLATEMRVAHPKLRYAGTLDKIVRWTRRGKSTLAQIDLKSGEVPRTVGPQTAAYNEAAIQTGVITAPFPASPCCSCAAMPPIDSCRRPIDRLVDLPVGSEPSPLEKQMTEIERTPAVLAVATRSRPSKSSPPPTR